VITAVKAPAADASAVELVGIRKSYGATVAVVDVSLEIPRGSVFGIVGPNGAGKSTTVGCILGLLEPDAGQVRVLGQDPRTNRMELFKRVGVKLQEDKGIYGRLRVREALDLFASFYDDPVDTDGLLKEFGLTSKSRAFFKDLSGGQKVRLLVALAMLGEPELLVLDEPTTGLDPQARLNLWRTMQEARDRGATVVVTTHYLEEAEEHCNDVAIIHDGFVVARGAPRELLRARGLTSHVSFPAPQQAEIAALGALDHVTHVAHVGSRVHVYGDGDLYEVITAPGGVRVDRAAIESRAARLEDLYLIETGREYGEE
jgi:ABC-2 type transport system ATP-binding protein